MSEKLMWKVWLHSGGQPGLMTLLHARGDTPGTLSAGTSCPNVGILPSVQKSHSRKFITEKTPSRRGTHQT